MARQPAGVNEIEQFDPLSPCEHLFKELHQTYWNYVSADEEAKLAEDSLYGWWWKFLKASDEYPPRRYEPADPMCEMHRDFGDLGESFSEWWRYIGRNLFHERAMVPLTQVIEIDQRHLSPGELPGWITVQIPMTIPRATIEAQLEEILRRYHPGNELLRHAASTARRKLYPNKRYHRDQIARLYDVWILRKQHPEWPLWRIGEELRIAAHLLAEDGDTETTIANKRRELGNRVQALHTKAKKLIKNAARGDFPRYSEVSKKERRERQQEGAL